MMDVRVTFERRLGAIGARLFTECTELVVRHERRRKAAVSFVILDDPAMRAINAQFLGHDYETDVITFPLGEPGEPDGEIYISADTARRQAAEYRVPLREEIARLAVHGVLHLCGYDDTTPDAAARMHAVQERLLHTWQSKSSVSR